MTDVSANNKRIAKNTLFLYFRMLFLVGIQLYCVPIVLKGLGVECYGIYNVVGGVVALFSFLGSSLASGSQRFLAYAIGKNDELMLKNVFDTTMTIYILIAVGVILVFDPICIWFLNKKMLIPEKHLFAANVVLQLSFISFIVNLVSIPFNAAIIAHEKMSIYAYVSILEGILKLVAAFMLGLFKTDVLIVYASLILGVNIFLRVIYQVYCWMKYQECRHVRFILDKYIRKQLMSYLSWNVIGALANILRQQGLNVVINLFFGTILNAAHAIVLQLYGVLSQFVTNIYLASRPQLTKSFASGKIDEMWSLMNCTSKIVFFLLTIISIPILFEGNFFLGMWLGEIPPYTLYMLRLFMISLLLETLVNPIIGVFQAQNKIRRYQIFSSTIILLIVPFSYIFLKFFNQNPLIPYYVTVFFSILFVVSILIIAKIDLFMNVSFFIKNVLVREIAVFVLLSMLVFAVQMNIETSCLRIFIILCIVIFGLIPLVWMIGINKQERTILKNFIKKRITHEST